MRATTATFTDGSHRPALAAAGGIFVTRFQRTLEFCSRPCLQGRLEPMMGRWVRVPPSRRARDPLKHVVEAD
jgi:hypothetical protein